MIEKHEAYYYHVTFNAMHNIAPDDSSKMHAHTFRVGMYVIAKQKEHAAFLSIEHRLNDYFKRYQGVRLNDLALFSGIIPTLENIGNVFYSDLKPDFEINGMQLLSLEIGDSPLSVYSVGERLLLGTVSSQIPEDKIAGYCSRVRRRYDKDPVKGGI